MKGPALHLLTVISLVFFLILSAAAVCNGTWTPTITETYSPPGPYGTIHVESSPAGAAVYLDGEGQGYAPVTIRSLWPGTYTISVRRAGYKEFTTTASMPGAKYLSVYCMLVPENSGNGLYVISVPPNADIYLDDLFRGKAPLMISSGLTTGMHALRVRLSGYDEWKSAAEVPSGGTRTITAVLNQNDTVTTQGISISSDPAGATIILDSRTRGITPKTLYNIAGGIHVLELGYPGYDPWKSAITVPETEIKTISINLTRKNSPPGWIMVSSNPGDALVTLDGNFAGRTPFNGSLSLDNVPAGDHIIELDLHGYQRYSANISVSSRLVSFVSAVFKEGSGTSEKGAISVTSDPKGATIYIDNGFVGISPLMVSDIVPGNHSVIFRMEGYQEKATSIVVAAGTTGNVSTNMLQVTPSLHTSLNPLSALSALCIVLIFTLRTCR